MVILLTIIGNNWWTYLLAILIFWILISVLYYQRKSPLMLQLEQWLILPAFMIFGPHQKKTATKSADEVEKFSSYFEETPVLKKLQEALRKRSNVNLENIQVLRSELSDLQNNYQHQSNYVTQLSQKISAQTPSIPNLESTIQNIINQQVTSISNIEEDNDWQEDLAVFESVLRQIQKDVNQKIVNIQQQQKQQQEGLSTQFTNLEQKVDKLPSPEHMNQVWLKLSQRIDVLQSSFQQLQHKHDKSPIAPPIVPPITEKIPPLPNQNPKKTSKIESHIADQKVNHLAENTPIISDIDEVVNIDFESLGVKSEKDIEKLESSPLTNAPIKAAPIIDLDYLSSPSVRADINFEDRTGRTYYAPAPQDEIFDPEQLTTYLIPQNSLYEIKVSHKDPKRAWYNLINQESVLKYARTNAKAYIQSATFLRGDGDIQQAHEISLKCGEMELMRGGWVIIKKAVLSFK